MKATHKLNTVLLALFLTAGLVACDKAGSAETAGKSIDQQTDKLADAMNKPGPAESAGKTLDQKTDAAGKKIEKVTNEVVDSLNKEGNKAGVAIDDAGITTKIKAAILAEPGLKSLQISVKTVKGVVTLSGSVDTQANSDMAKGLSGAVAGVSSVNNNLAVKKSK
jgi:osmotically-inducible protein OsmY